MTTTQQVYIGPVPGTGSNTINIINTTNQTVTGQISADDVTGDYQPAANLTLATNTALVYSMADGWLRFTCTAPTSGSLVVAR